MNVEDEGFKGGWKDSTTGCKDDRESLGLNVL
jgi:hypothetical protein